MKSRSDFEARMKSARRSGNIMSKIVIGFIIFVFVLILSIWGVVGFYATSLDWNHGLKGVAEQIWTVKQKQE